MPLRSSACLLLAALALLACNKLPRTNPGALANVNKTPPPSDSTTAPTELTVAYIGNFHGFQKPCGCTDRQDGGLPRVSTALAAAALVLGGKAKAADALPQGMNLPELTPQPLEFFDCGNFSDPHGRQPGLRDKTHLAELAHLGAKAAVLGGDESLLPLAEAQVAFKDSHIPLVSCNLNPAADSGVTVVPSAPLAPGWYVIGVTLPPPVSAKNAVQKPWASVSDPLAGAQATLVKLPPHSHAVIAAAQLPPELARRLATLSGVAAVIGYQPAEGGWPAGVARGLPQPKPRATDLAFASLSTSSGAASEKARSFSLEMSDAWKDDGAVVQLIRDGNSARLQQAASNPEQWRETSWTMQQRFIPAATAPPPPEETYAGGDSCKSCHAAAYAKWEASQHYASYQPLLTHHEAQTLDCLECHTTGLLQPGGYNPDQSWDVLKDPKARVGCESCHGPGTAHINLAKSGKLPRSGGQSVLKISRGSLDACVRCHDPYNSPRFKADAYWAKIRH